MSGPLDVLRELINNLAEQQAMPDDWWKEPSEAVLAAVEQLARDVEYVEGVLSRDPFDETQRKFAAELLRDALARLQAGSPAACEHEWVSARNEAVLSGLICVKCHALATEEGT